MINTILVLSKQQQQCHTVGLLRRSRPSTSLDSSSFLAASWHRQPRRTMVSSSSILNTAAHRHHGGDDDPRRLPSPRLQLNVFSTADVGCWLAPFPIPFQQINFNSRGRSFSSESDNSHNQDQPRKASQDGERRSGQRGRPQQKKQQQQNELLTVSDILADYTRRCKQLKPSQVSSVWNHLGKAVQKSRNWEEMQNFWMDHKASLQTLVDHTICSADRFNGRSTATVTQSLVKLQHLTNSKSIGDDHQLLWNALLRRTILLLQSNEFNAQDISNLLWAYAKAADGINVIDGPLLDVLAKTASIGIADFNPQDLANTAWAFATLNYKAPLLFDAIASAAPARIGDFTPQDLSNTAWAFAKLNHEAPLLFEAIARAALVRIHDFYPQALSNTAWSFAKLNHEAPALLDAIADAAQVRINDLNPQDLANTAWSFATLHQEAPSLFDSIARAAPVRINEFNSQDLANTAWSFATLNHRAPALLDAIARAAQVGINEFKPQELANTAWSFATLNHEAPALFEAIATAAPVRIGDFNPQELANTAWALATLNHEAPLLFDAIAKTALVRINDFNPHNLANTAWSLATMNYEEPSLFDAIARAAQERIRDFNPQNLSNMAWSFAVFDIESGSFTHFDSPFAQTLLSRDPLSFSVENIGQLHQFQLWCQEQTGASWFPDKLSQRCREAFVSTEAKPSRLQNRVVESLRALEAVSQVEVEGSTKSGYSLDAVVMLQGEQRIGVEVDGPSHFVGQSQSPNGATLLKRRQLQNLEGWKLVSIPYWAWYGMDKDGSNKERREKEKELYLQNLLYEALVVSK
jgi:RAP domain